MFFTTSSRGARQNLAANQNRRHPQVMTAKIDMGCDASGRPVKGNAHFIQQVVIDPEGDFASLSDGIGHIVIVAAEYIAPEIAGFAAPAREHRASVVLNLEGLEIGNQMKCAAALFDAPRDARR